MLHWLTFIALIDGQPIVKSPEYATSVNQSRRFVHGRRILPKLVRSSPRDLGKGFASALGQCAQLGSHFIRQAGGLAVN